MRVGIGYDIHRLVRGRPLILGGVRVVSPVGSLGHSDGDAVLHALTDAVLGAAALGDIGDHFPDQDKAHRGRDSADFIRRALALAARKGLVPVNADIVVIAERPKLSAYKSRIRARVAALMGLPVSRVGLQAKTHEGLGELGSGRAIAAQAAVLLKERKKR
ncbi:MAG: 2-C-methyl-D-erythritol 2,4-cyclodiphosphate synthase [Candidatus Omnitrophica bacterium]|nr:2-C-methyl-D-erythritol 2,4-cyclodiphosphate synthase [Candidatus Omnitrophota bacterium]